MIPRKFTLAALSAAVLLAACAQTPNQSAPAAAASTPAAVSTVAQMQRQAVAQGLYELAFSPRQNAVFVASSGGFGPTAGPSRVLRLNPQTLAIEGEIPLERKAFGVALDDANNRLYIGNTVDTSVTVIDTAASKVLGVVQLQQKTKTADGKERYTHDLRELVADPANNRLFVTGHTGSGDKSSVMFVVDTRTMQVVKTIEGLGNAKAPGLAFDPKGNRLFVTNLLGELITIDTRSLTVAKRVNTGIEQPMNIAFDAAANRLFVTDQGLEMIRNFQAKSIPGFVSKNPGNRVVVLDADTGREQASIAARPGPMGILLDAPRNRLFVTNREAGSVQVFDTRNLSLVQTIEAPVHPNSFALDARNNVVYVSIKNGDKDPKTAAESVLRLKF